MGVAGNPLTADVSEHGEPFDLADEFLRVMGLLYVAKRHDDVERRRVGSSTWAQDFVLAAVLNAGSVRITELAALAGVSTPSMTVALNRLALRGLIRRIGDPVDKRIVTVVVTPKGERQYRQSMESMHAELTARLRDLTEQDRRALKEAVPALNALVDLELTPRVEDRAV